MTSNAAVRTGVPAFFPNSSPRALLEGPLCAGVVAFMSGTFLGGPAQCGPRQGWGFSFILSLTIFYWPPLESWFQKRRRRRLFGPGYSSDNAGDGPSSDSEDEYIHDSVESDGDEYTPVDSPLGMKAAWTFPIIEAYLRSHDFSFVTIWAMSHLDPFNAERHLNLLSAATHIAVEAQVLEGKTTYCCACKMFLWAHTHTHN